MHLSYLTFSVSTSVLIFIPVDALREKDTDGAKASVEAAKRRVARDNFILICLSIYRLCSLMKVYFVIKNHEDFVPNHINGNTLVRMYISLP